VDLTFFFSAKKKVTKEKTRGCASLLFKLVIGQCLCYPQSDNAAFSYQPLVVLFF